MCAKRLPEGNHRPLALWIDRSYLVVGPCVKMPTAPVDVRQSLASHLSYSWMCVEEDKLGGEEKLEDTDRTAVAMVAVPELGLRKRLLGRLRQQLRNGYIVIHE